MAQFSTAMLDAGSFGVELRAMPRQDRERRDHASLAGRDEWVRDRWAGLGPAWNCASACRAAALAAAPGLATDVFAVTEPPCPDVEELPDGLLAGRPNSGAALLAKAWMALVLEFQPRGELMHEQKRKQLVAQTRAALALPAVAVGAGPKESGQAAAQAARGARVLRQFAREDAAARLGRWPTAAGLGPVCREVVPRRVSMPNRSPIGEPLPLPPCAPAWPSLRSPGPRAQALEREVVLLSAPAQLRL